MVYGVWAWEGAIAIIALVGIAEFALHYVVSRDAHMNQLTTHTHTHVAQDQDKTTPISISISHTHTRTSRKCPPSA